MDLTLLAIAMSKLVAKLTLGDRASALAADLADVIGAAIPDKRTRNSERRHFEGIGERLAAELETYFDVEYGGLADNERLAATEALIKALDAASVSSQTLLDIDLDSKRLESILSPLLPDARLSSAGQAFLMLLLRETCAFSVASAIAYPAATNLIAVESLKRSTEIALAIDRAIEQIPRDVAATLDQADPRQFEVDYRRSAVNVLDRLRLFGMPPRPNEKVGYPLSIAYLSLTASMREGGRARTATVEELLSQGRRWVIRGPAGSGKTTLLQWLGVRAAQRSLDGELSSWNKFVPFFIPLRNFVGPSGASSEPVLLPDSSRFADHCAGVLRNSVPKQWIDETLRQGRGLVLIDGLDEIPPSMLDQVNTWIAELILHFGKSAFIVTSRPHSLNSVSLAGDDFRECALERMNERSVHTFLTYWHRAAIAQAAPDEVNELRALEARLHQSFDSNAELNELATTPLFCAMLCALNRDRGADMPEDRLKLYEETLEIVVSRREKGRNVQPMPTLATPQVLEILEEIAYWTLKNDATTLSWFELRAACNRVLPTLTGVTFTETEVAQSIAYRSGVLIEPSQGEFGFVHLSFRDFLAASAIVGQDDVGLLMREQHAGRWHSVVVFAAGLGNKSQQRKIFQKLLTDQVLHTDESGKRTSTYPDRPGQEFLALACVEVCRSVPPDALARISARIDQIVPPKTLQAARLVAAAGPAAVAALRRVLAEVPADSAILTIIALAQTREAEAAAVLAKWASDPRREVRDAVAATWWRFDAELFAEVVLPQFDDAHDPPHLTVGPSHWQWADRFQWVRSITLLDPPEGGNWRLPTAQIRVLKLNGLVDDELDIRQFARLEELEIEHASSLRMIRGLAQSRTLRKLTIKGAHAWSASVSVPSELHELELLQMSAIDSVNASSSRLVRLVIDECEKLAVVQRLQTDRLEEVVINRSGMDSMDWLEGAESLTRFRAARYRGAAIPLNNALGLTSLELLDCNNVDSLWWLPPSLVLARIQLSGSGELTDIRSLASCRNVQSIDLSFCPNLRDLTPLADLEELADVNLTGCMLGLDLSVLDHVPYVEFPYPA